MLRLCVQISVLPVFYSASGSRVVTLVVTVRMLVITDLRLLKILPISLIRVVCVVGTW